MKMVIEDVMSNLIDDILLEHDISREKAEQLIIDAMTYNDVAFSIYRKVDELLTD